MRADTPLKAIACFDAVMRTGSVLEASRQLFLTPGAVGQQIRKLEDWLGTPLFVRAVRKLQPTSIAMRYWDQVRPALEQLDKANHSLKGDELPVRFTLPPAFASTWFARRIPQLTRLYPQLNLHLSAMIEQVDLNQAPFDLAIRHFDGVAAGMDATLLLADEVRVYGSPGYRERMGLNGITDLPAATLLYTTSHAHWSKWLALADITIEGLGTGLRFDQSELAIDAARRGQGLVLTSPWLVEDDIDQHRLMQIFEPVLSTGKGYYLLYPHGTTLREPVEIFRRWLFTEAARCTEPL